MHTRRLSRAPRPYAGPLLAARLLRRTRRRPGPCGGGEQHDAELPRRVDGVDGLHRRMRRWLAGAVWHRLARRQVRGHPREQVLQHAPMYGSPTRAGAVPREVDRVDGVHSCMRRRLAGSCRNHMARWEVRCGHGEHAMQLTSVCDGRSRYRAQDEPRCDRCAERLPDGDEGYHGVCQLGELPGQLCDVAQPPGHLLARPARALPALPALTANTTGNSMATVRTSKHCRCTQVLFSC